MITFLEGTVEMAAEKFIVLNTNGVGYKIFGGSDMLSRASVRGATLRVWVHHHVREDAQDLYGFAHYAELEFFEMLLSISGIGPKGALGILGIAPVDALKRAIAVGDTSYLTRVSGIGRKIAEKVVLELKEKMAGKGVMVEAPELREEADALDALVALGYSLREARDALGAVSGEGITMHERIRAALKRMGGGR